MIFLGVDGCPAGWIAVRWSETVTHHIFTSFAEVIASDADVIAVDMPIGFPELAGRAAEKQARKVLGDRQSSLFAMPSRAAVMCEDYRTACAANLKHSDPPKKISKQAFNLFPKIREIDKLIAPDMQTRIHEAHPELAFWRMNGKQALTLPKKVKSKASEQGLEQRRELLRCAGFPLEQLPDPIYRKSDVGDDDLLDACANAVTARHIARGEAIVFPDRDERDANGLLMRISC
jgi:predicted RNase H-like nuclease